MPIKVTVDPNSGEHSYALDTDWFEWFVRKFGGKKESPVLDYRTSHARSAYTNSNLKWVEIRSDSGLITAPYELVYDYRNRRVDSKSLGAFKKGVEYEFPGALCPLRDAETARREKENKLQKGDKPALRVADVSLTDQKIVYTLQEAWYYQQVGSNLSPDAIDSVEFSRRSGDDQTKNHVTPREWDMLQAGLSRELPPFSKSKLANTIGVAYGINVRTKDRRLATIRRFRGPHVDVYANMWHVPLSFALSYSPPLPLRGAMEAIINPDFAQELGQETGLELHEIKIKPLAFTRDLCRAGKPQFFFEIETSVGFDDLNKRLKKCRDEYKGRSELLVLGDNLPIDDRFDGSPELLAYLLLQDSG